jgi:hypothetical protein
MPTTRIYREILDSGVGLPRVYRRSSFQKGELAVITEPANPFARMFRGYDPAAVDAYIEKSITKQQLLLDDVESLSLDPPMGVVS